MPFTASHKDAFKVQTHDPSLTNSLEDPLVLVACYFAFVLLAFPLLVVGGLFPYLVEVVYFLQGLCFNLKEGSKIRIYIRSILVEVLAELANASLKKCDFFRGPGLYDIKV
jgi:hypothetical protein